jgi:hypothetical protein
MQKKWYVFALGAVMALAIACGSENKTPASPSSTTSNGSAAAAADGSTLKVTAPALVSPADGVRLENKTPTLVAQNATFQTQSVSGVSLVYRFQVVTTGGTLVEEALESSGAGGQTGGTAHVVTTAVNLANDTTYRWRVRAEASSGAGPWSGYLSFVTPNSPSAMASYQTATTLWDNLTDGKTLGGANNMEFNLATNGVGGGARTISQESFIQYALRQTLTVGECSFYVDNFNALAKGGKSKFATQSSNAADITTDPWRFTLEKRGIDYVSPGQIRWRIITGNNESAVYDGGPWDAGGWLDKTKTYFVKYTWGNGVVTLQIVEADKATGVLGTVKMNVSGTYKNTYRPPTHWVTIGAEAGRAGSSDASVPNMTVRWFWVSDGQTKRPGMRAEDLFSTMTAHGF